MFSLGGFGTRGYASAVGSDNAPPATPINLPNFQPQLEHDAASDNQALAYHITTLLQTVTRPLAVKPEHLNGLGVHFQGEATLSELIPDPQYLPDFALWDTLSLQEALDREEQAQSRLDTGAQAPGILYYVGRRLELSIPNDQAFRVVRRLDPIPGKPLVKVGNSYDFFKHLEGMTTFWDDTSALVEPPPDASLPDPVIDLDEALTPLPMYTKERWAGRSSNGAAMPLDMRVNLVNAFIKLVVYEHGCNIVAAKTEPRMCLYGPPPAQSTATANRRPSSKRHVYFPSACTFLVRRPTARVAVREGVTEGPVAAVSIRNFTNFPPTLQDETTPLIDQASVVDLSREIVAALLTAQHRDRAGKTERLSGEGQWWANTKRWGGAAGGPIGRELDASSAGEVFGDKDLPMAAVAGAVSDASEGIILPASRRDLLAPLRKSDDGKGSGVGSASRGNSARGPSPARISRDPRIDLVMTPPARLRYTSTGVSSQRPQTSTSDRPVSLPSKEPAAKRPRRAGDSAYDNYRLMKPPPAVWDPKARYEAIGRQQGTDYDDIFVVSSLFHHVSILRVRVPDRLLVVLAGDDDGYDSRGIEPKDKQRRTERSWGSLKVHRTPWYDLFKIEDRQQALKMVWAVTAYLTRQRDKDSS